MLIQLLNYLGAIDLAPLIGPDMALTVVTGVAIAKALLAFIESRVKPQ